MAQATRTTTLLVGFPAGSGVDYVARLLADRLQQVLNRTFIVDNRVGASGRIAMEQLKRAPNDGSVLAVVPSGMLSIFPSFYRKLAYDPLKDYTAVAKFCDYHMGLASATTAPYKTLPEFLEWAKRNPANYGHPGMGTAPHFTGYLLAQDAGVKLQDVSYRGGPQLTQATIGGEIALAANLSGTFRELAKGGRIRLLAVTAPQRSPTTPDVPTLAELGFPNGVVQENIGLLAPVGLDRALVAQLADAVRQVAAEQAFQEKLQVGDYSSAYLDGAAYVGLTTNAQARWAKVIERSGFRADE
ncbi:tripartite-type tricarboxylate transporter receptor subunit TctC [Pseudorhodoferax soli]|uniref:Tripartite-type tricarboxylate transporter receptor subunit TctC n=2 Tax=Pseudorhodoferax soli TaxID=545864 RepID=A0A368X6Q7_9BURK|nr:tripartite-type tricarboxylate transporter receptor subunit TctC [Pseudorhodoferax soli]